MGTCVSSASLAVAPQTCSRRREVSSDLSSPSLGVCDVQSTRHLLPPELFAHIFTYLTNVDDLVAAAGVCRLWRFVIIDQHLIQLRLRWTGATRALSHSYPHLFHATTQLDVDCCNVADGRELLQLKALLSHLPNLRVLHISFLFFWGWFIRSNYDQVKCAANTFSQLATSSLSSLHIKANAPSDFLLRVLPHLASRCSHTLRELAYSGGVMDVRCCRFIGQNFPNLDSLHLLSYGGFWAAISLSEMLRHLSTIDFQVVYSILWVDRVHVGGEGDMVDALGVVLQSPSKARVQQLARSMKLTKKKLKKMVMGVSNLSSCYADTVWYFPHMTKLSLQASRAHTLTSSQLQKLSRCKELVWL